MEALGLSQRLFINGNKTTRIPNSLISTYTPSSSPDCNILCVCDVRIPCVVHTTLHLGYLRGIQFPLHCAVCSWSRWLQNNFWWLSRGILLAQAQYPAGMMYWAALWGSYSMNWHTDTSCCSLLVEYFKFLCERFYCLCMFILKSCRCFHQIFFINSY